MSYDVFADVFHEPLVNDTALDGLVKSAQELVDLTHQIEDLTELLQKMNSKANDLKTQIIPDKMAEIGLSEFKLPSGHKVKVEDFVSGAMPKGAAQRQAAIEEMSRIGGSDLLKTEVDMFFDKSQHNEALALADDLRIKGYDPEIKTGVHPQTYLAFIREKIKNGEQFDPTKLGVFVGRRAKLEIKK